MAPESLASPWMAEQPAWLLKVVATVGLLVFFWSWETWFPFRGWGGLRWRHAGHNLALALLNTLLLALLFGTATVLVTAWAMEHRLGLLHRLPLPPWAAWGLALVLLDAWMYLWHRANHAVPLLWRFHRMHHSDTHMDVTTATRFHLGEHAGSALLRLAWVPVLGFELGQLLLYDTLVVAVTMLHHADISLGRWDRRLRWLLVTPFLHKVHHSRWLPETNSNYATVLSVWDRLARTIRLREIPETIRYGLDGWDDPHWQTLAGMLQTPFVRQPVEEEQATPARLAREDRETVSAHAACGDMR